MAPFSGGEKARLVLGIVAYQRPNLLLLDEPTNHLDLEMRQALAMALQDYEGAVVMVSHDRHLLRTVSDEFYIVHDGRAQPFDGDLDDYASWLASTASTASAAVSASTQAAAEAQSAAPLTAEDRKQRKREDAERRARLAPLRSKIEKSEKRLTQLATQAAALEAQLADPAIYAEAQKKTLLELTARRAAIGKETEEVEAAWMAASEELEQAGG